VVKETGETAHVERWNNTLRQRLARFLRMTLSFSKSVVMLRPVVATSDIRSKIRNETLGAVLPLSVVDNSAFSPGQSHLLTSTEIDKPAKLEA
jgi:hypothetical protein